jgi:hypothetical protein
MKNFDNSTYQKPARAGIAYMTAPLMRSYSSPDATEVVTMSASHYMFYAPNVKDTRIGGKSSSVYPFVLSQGPGRRNSSACRSSRENKAKRRLNRPTERSLLLSEIHVPCLGKSPT